MQQQASQPHRGRVAGSKMKTKTMEMVVVVVISCLLLILPAGAEEPWTMNACHSDDKAALLGISAALGNPYVLSSWTPDDPCCEWAGVYCDPSSARVLGLFIDQDDNVTGTIPGDAIAGLAHLQSLRLHHLPGISGHIPPAIAKLKNLSMLTISWTSVSGPVPSFLGALTRLALLDLSFNSLTGAIPASLAALPNLSGINLSRNRLTGAIPAQLLSKSSSADQQIYLWLSHNNLSGAIPAGFAAAGFAHLDLSRNNFAGDASGLFGRAKELQYLDISRNAFSFNLSGGGVELPEQLYFMDVSHNAIYGGIPAQVASLTNLQFFNVSYNRLCGVVPAGGHMGRFDAYSYQHNKCLCGAPLADPCSNKQ